MSIQTPPPVGKQASSGPTKEGAQKAVSTYSGFTSDLIMVLGKSGYGKTFSLQNVDPSTSFLLQVTRKRLPFMGARRWEESGRIEVSSDPNRILLTLDKLSKDNLIQNIFLDDAQYIMGIEFMDKATVKGYDKFSVMAKNFWNILMKATKLRPGLKVFVLCHEDDDGNYRRIKTLGKLLEDKMTPEGLCTVVLFCEIEGTKTERLYQFATQTDGNTTAKSPYGMFPSLIKNDLNLVIKRMNEYYDGIHLKDSKLQLTYN